MSTPLTSNGNSITWRWLTGICVSVLLTIGGFMYVAMAARVATVETALTTSIKETSERLVRIETILQRIERVQESDGHIARKGK